MSVDPKEKKQVVFSDFYDHPIWGFSNLKQSEPKRFGCQSAHIKEIMLAEMERERRKRWNEYLIAITGSWARSATPLWPWEADSDIDEGYETRYD